MLGLSRRIKVEWLAVLILLVSFFFLFFHLDLKPPQHDEGVNGWFIEDLIAKGYYEYDPANYHGPLHYYLLFLFKLLFGSNLWALRLSAVLFGWASVYLLLEFRHYVGRFTAYTAALLAGVSPGMIFYSRYAIHESALLFFVLLTFLGFFRYEDQKDRRSLWLIGMGVTGMVVTKETFVLMLFSMAFSWLVVRIYEQFSPSTTGVPHATPSFQYGDVLRVVLTALGIYILLYSGFFLNWQGVAGIFATFGSWFIHGFDPVAGQKGHFKDFVYWLQLFLRYEWPAFAGLLLCFPLLGPVPYRLRFLGVFGTTHFLIYSLIPYKTPWCILQLIWPFLLVTAGMLQEFAAKSSVRRGIAFLIITGLSLVSAQKSVALNFFHYTDEREPYVNVQTYEDIMRITGRIKTLAQEDRTKKHMPINVVMKSYWPISWLLKDFTKSYYYTKGLPPKADAGVIFCDIERRRALELKLKDEYFVQTFRLNPAQAETTVYYQRKIFDKFFDDETELFVPVTLPPPRPGEGLRARYFSNRQWEGPPAFEEIVGTVDFSWERGETPLEPPFSIEFSGQIEIPDSGETFFYLASDDGSNLVIDGLVVVDNMGDHPEKIKSAPHRFEKGWHDIRIRFYDIGGAAVIRFWWKRPGGGQEKIHPRYFRPEALETGS